MASLHCEMCGSADLIKHNGVYICLNCGMKYSVEEMMAQVGGILSELDQLHLNELINSGLKLQAIKFVREKTGLSLDEAKEFVESTNPSTITSATNQGKNPSMITSATKQCKKCKTLCPAVFSCCPTCGSTEFETNESSAKKGCYIATCVYGSYDCPQVWTLRRYRDYTLAETWYGRTFILLYYATSPTLVKLFGKTNWFKRFWQGKLDRFVCKLNEKGIENTTYQDKEW